MLPYIALYPELSLVVDDGTGTAVGYIVGAPSGAEYVARYHTTIVPALLASGAFPPPPTANGVDGAAAAEAAMLHTLYAPDGDVLHGDFPALQARFPAHLHINLLPCVRRAGWGSELVRRFVALLATRGIRGVHAIMGDHNVRAGAERFYGRVGFRRFHEVLDGGHSGELGRHADGCVWMVRELNGRETDPYP